MSSTPRPPIAEKLLDNQSNAVLLLDRELGLLTMNPSAENLLSTSLSKARKSGMGELFAENPRLAASMSASLETGHPCTLRELTLDVPGHRRVTVDCTITPLQDPVLGYTVLVEMMDVDRHLRIAREEQLLSLHQTTRHLIRGLAHEVKNPLGGLRGAAQLLDRELTDDGLREYTRIILHETDRLRALVDRMLGPNTLPRRQRINIHEPLEYVRQLVSVEFPGGHVRIEADYDPNIPEILADPDQLIQALLNIVRNAVQALRDTPDARIVLRTRIQRQFTLGNVRHKLVARIDIIDNGPGIPPAIQEHVFFPMVSGRPDGTGLGLSIAQTLIAQHGGLIEFTSQPGRTVFTLLLPVESDDEPNQSHLGD